MKVLFCYYLPSGGTETLNRQREKALQQINIRSHFLYLHAGSGIKNAQHSKVFITNNNVEINELINNEKYDAIVVNSDDQLLQRIRSFNYKGPLIFEVQGLGTKEQATKFLKHTAKENINKYSDAILCPKTKHLQQLLKSIYPHKKQFSFHNCIDTDVFSYRQQLKHHNLIIGWVGRIEKNKNWLDCLHIAKQLLVDFPNLELWMLIDDSLTTSFQKKSFEHTLQRLQLRQIVKIHNNILHTDMPKFYSLIADSGGFLLATSIMEGFGYAVLEAMSCKCPVLTSNSDGVQSFVFHNLTGKMYHHGNINEAVNEAKNLILDKQLRQSLAEQGVAYVKKHFNLRQYAQQFNNMINELIK